MCAAASQAAVRFWNQWLLTHRNVDNQARHSSVPHMSNGRSSLPNHEGERVRITSLPSELKSQPTSWKSLVMRKRLHSTYVTDFSTLRII